MVNTPEIPLAGTPAYWTAQREAFALVHAWQLTIADPDQELILLRRIAERLAQRFPTLRVVGYFKAEGDISAFRATCFMGGALAYAARFEEDIACAIPSGQGKTAIGCSASSSIAPQLSTGSTPSTSPSWRSRPRSRADVRRRVRHGSDAHV